MPITGIHVGDFEFFFANPVPKDIPFPSGTVDTWTASDPSIVLAPGGDPVADPGESIVKVSVPADSTLTTFDLSVSSQMPPDEQGVVPAPLTATAAIPVIPGPIPPAPRPSGVSIEQMPKVGSSRR